MTAASLFSNLGHAIFSGDSWKMAVPAFLYTLANSLQYVGISNLDAATFQVVYQFKIIVTAVFSVVMLQKSISTRQWISLILLMVGVAIVSLPEDEMESLVSSHHSRIYSPRSISPLSQRLGQLYSGYIGTSNIMKRSATYEGIAEDEWALNNNAGSDAVSGLIATIAVCICSGFAGVYLEKVMKESHKASSLWIRNVQLSIYSLFPAFFIGVIFLDGETVSKYGFFDGYNWVVVLSIAIQSLGGILAAFVIFYADNISKNFAVSISMVLSSLASFVFFDFTATTNVSNAFRKDRTDADDCSSCSALPLCFQQRTSTAFLINHDNDRHLSRSKIMRK
jgi:drug/metabolite transporter (DMT)-like permease